MKDFLLKEVEKNVPWCAPEALMCFLKHRDHLNVQAQFSNMLHVPKTCIFYSQQS